MRRLTFRMANVRKHNIISPSLRLLVATRRPINGQEQRSTNDVTPTLSEAFDDTEFVQLGLEGPAGRSQETVSVFLALPATVSHVIDAASPLAGCELADLDRLGMELVLILNGIDAPTSTGAYMHGIRPWLSTKDFLWIHLTARVYVIMYHVFAVCFQCCIFVGRERCALALACSHARHLTSLRREQCALPGAKAHARHLASLPAPRPQCSRRRVPSSRPTYYKVIASYHAFHARPKGCTWWTSRA